MNDALKALDQPTFDAINTYIVSRAVRDAGITVALAGTGGDELFGGYRSFQDIPSAASWSRALGWVPENLLRAASTAITRWKTGPSGDVPPQTRWGKLGDVLASRGSILKLYQTSYALFTSDFMGELVKIPLSEAMRDGLPLSRKGELSRLIEHEPSLHAISMLELSCFIGERLLRDTDAASMAVSLEARVPLLDHEVIEAAACVSFDQRFQPLGRKRLLRDIGLRGLDPALFERAKTGFVLPIDRWCRAGLKTQLDDAFSDRAGRESVGLNPDSVQRLWKAYNDGAPGLYWSRIWALFVLLWWCREHRMSI